MWSMRSFDDLEEAWLRCGSGRWRSGPRGRRSPFPRCGITSPGQQVHARLQLTGRGLLRKPVAGVDVRGDGAFMPYRGGVRREELDPSGHETPFDLVRETLES